MTISEKLSKSLDLLNKFENEIIKPKNNKNILSFIHNLTSDLEKYTSLNSLDKSDLDNIDNKTKIREIINRIDNLNRIVLPKSKLSDNFVELNSIK